jgi:hypothetical protein
MNDFDTSPSGAAEEKEHSGPSSSIHYRPPVAGCNDRIVELEVENSRLHRLVAELLIKNQQLRKPD